MIARMGSPASVVMATHMEARQNADFAEKQSVGQAAGNTKHVACEPSLKVSGRCV